jgi:hypothetical protein
MPGCWVYDGAAWQLVSQLQVYDGGTWRTITDAWVYDGSTWRKFFPDTPSISSVTSWWVCVDCIKASPGCWCRSYCNVASWDSGTYRLDAYYRGTSDQVSCTSSYTLFASDITVSAGQSATQESTYCTDCEYNTSYDYRPAYQWEWRIYRRSDSALIDSLAGSCIVETVRDCFA